MEIIDLHTHGLGGFDSRSTDLAHLLKIADLHGARGTKQIVLSLYPSAIPVMRTSMALVREAMQVQAAIPKEDSARILGVHLEGPFLNPIKAGALNALYLLEPDEHFLRQLLDGFEDIIRIMTIAPELDKAPSLIRMVADNGICVNMGHSNATFSEAEAGFRAGAKGITHLFNAMSGIHHREPGLAGFGLMHKEIYIEVIGDPFHLHPEIIHTIFAHKPADRIVLISDSVKETHASLQPAEMTDSRGILMGGSLALADAAEHLIHIGLHREMVLACITENPARYLARD